MKNRHKVQGGGNCQDHNDPSIASTAAPAPQPADPSLWNSSLGRREFLRNTGKASAVTAIASTGMMFEVSYAASAMTAVIGWKLDIPNDTTIKKSDLDSCRTDSNNDGKIDDSDEFDMAKLKKILKDNYNIIQTDITAPYNPNTQQVKLLAKPVFNPPKNISVFPPGLDVVKGIQTVITHEIVPK